MKKRSFITIFIAVHVVFVLIHIHKYSNVIKASYEKQKNESLIASLRQKKEELINKLCVLENRTNILQFAKNLKMEPINLKQIKKLSINEPQHTI